MAAPVPYLQFAGIAADALKTYRDVFGGDLELHTFAEFGRRDGAPSWIAHGELRGPVDLFGSDAADGAASVQVHGVLFALLGAGDAVTSRRWFDALAATGTVIEAMGERPWGDVDGQVRDAFGVTWLIGYSPAGA
ncbi:VOC family protein [Microbacterium sp. Clip185]|uniref:VOC family protein n=1 Tax=Microbacterium sp. Clip185 TaxID=3025663 RepID=UPI00236547AE|nr:VOC family protein [Microbacterium sp. Clip185]WDG17460.1 VOC family protein [Microbacterium sp. Clip185]